MAMTFPTLSSGLQLGRFELHFPSLHPAGWDVSVPCDAAGHVDLDALDEHVRNDYFFARAMLGREFAPPRVETSRLR